MLLFICGAACHRRHLVRDERIRVEVEPRIISAGSVCRVKVYAPPDAVEVSGLAEMWGSPRYRLKYDEKCSCWRGRGMVPIDAIIRPGTYSLRAEVKYADGNWGYASTTIEFK